jgi:hypothetical protein
MGGLLLSLPLYNKDRQFCRNSLAFYHLFFGNMKYSLLEINQLASKIDYQPVTKRCIIPHFICYIIYIMLSRLYYSKGNPK